MVMLLKITNPLKKRKISKVKERIERLEDLIKDVEDLIEKRDSLFLGILEDLDNLYDGSLVEEFDKSKKMYFENIGGIWTVENTMSWLDSVIEFIENN